VPTDNALLIVCESGTRRRWRPQAASTRVL